MYIYICAYLTPGLKLNHKKTIGPMVFFRPGNGFHLGGRVPEDDSGREAVGKM